MKKDNKKEGEEKNNNKSSSSYKPLQRRDTPARDLFGRFFDDNSWMEPLGLWRLNRALRRIDKRLFPRVDVGETEKDIRITADIPGVDPENMDISVQDNHISLRGVIQHEAETEEDIRPYRYERSYGEFRRDFNLPAKIKEDEVKATYKDGILTIVLPKVEEERKNKIKIEKQ